jgi:hypothetical protein
VEICDVKKLLEVLTAILAVGAACSWAVVAWYGWFDFLQTVMAKVERYLKFQAIFNAIAAACAGAAAIMQLVTTAYMPVCRAFASADADKITAVTYEDRTPTHGYEPTRGAAMAAFAKSWRRE